VSLGFRVLGCQFFSFFLFFSPLNLDVLAESNVVEQIGDDETEWRAVSTGADTVIWPQGKVIKGVKETVKGDGWVIELENRKQLLDDTGDEETETTTTNAKSNLGMKFKVYKPSNSTFRVVLYEIQWRP
jgi:hypothetical protein